MQRFGRYVMVKIIMTARFATHLFLLLFFSVVVFHQVRAQNEYIVVEKTLSNKQIEYSSGDEIKYKLLGEDFFRKDHIISLNDSSIEFHYHNILYSEISQVNIKGKRFTSFDIYNIGKYAQIVGIGYIAIDMFNKTVVQGQDAVFEEEVWIVGGMIFIGGTILKLCSPRKVKLGGKYRIRYMNLKG